LGKEGGRRRKSLFSHREELLEWGLRKRTTHKRVVRSPIARTTRIHSNLPERKDV